MHVKEVQKRLDTLLSSGGTSSQTDYLRFMAQRNELSATPAELTNPAICDRIAGMSDLALKQVNPELFSGIYLKSTENLSQCRVVFRYLADKNLPALEQEARKKLIRIVEKLTPPLSSAIEEDCLALINLFLDEKSSLKVLLSERMLKMGPLFNVKQHSVAEVNKTYQEFIEDKKGLFFWLSAKEVLQAVYDIEDWDNLYSIFLIDLACIFMNFIHDTQEKQAFHREIRAREAQTNAKLLLFIFEMHANPRQISLNSISQNVLEQSEKDITNKTNENYETAMKVLSILAQRLLLAGTEEDIEKVQQYITPLFYTILKDDPLALLFQAATYLMPSEKKNILGLLAVKDPQQCYSLLAKLEKIAFPFIKIEVIRLRIALSHQQYLQTTEPQHRSNLLATVEADLERYITLIKKNKLHIARETTQEITSIFMLMRACDEIRSDAPDMEKIITQWKLHLKFFKEDEARQLLASVKHALQPEDEEKKSHISQLEGLIAETFPSLSTPDIHAIPFQHTSPISQPSSVSTHGHIPSPVQGKRPATSAYPFWAATNSDTEDEDDELKEPLTKRRDISPKAWRSLQGGSHGS